MAAVGERAGHVPTAAGADDERLGAGAKGVGQGGTLVGQVVTVGVAQLVGIESGDVGGGIGVDHDAIAAFGAPVDQADAREHVPFLKNLVRDGLPLGVADVDHVITLIHNQKRDQRQRQRHRSHAPAHRTGNAVPDGGGNGEDNGRGQHRADSAEAVQQRV